VPYCPVGAFAQAAGIRIRNEAAFVDGLQYVAQRMMHHAVAKRRGTDQTADRIVYVETAICAWRIGTRGQSLMQLPELGFEVQLEAPHVGTQALALPGFVVGQQQIGEGDQRRIQVSIGFHRASRHYKGQADPTFDGDHLPAGPAVQRSLVAPEPNPEKGLSCSHARA